MDGLEEKVLATIRRYHMFDAGDRVLVAVSGGVDSMVLLTVLLKLPLGLRLAVFHLNHRLRPEAETEAALVQRYATEQGLPCYTERLACDLHYSKGNKSIQVAAREVRYQLLAATADRLGMDKIALGHHADDQAETVLMRFLTGAGPEGLAGIPPVRDRYVRPLLEVGRAEILAYARQAGLSWAEDASNLKPVYLRNRLRHGLLPYLEKEYQPGLRGRLRETAAICREWKAVMEGLAEAVLKDWGLCQADGKLAPNRRGGYLLPVAPWLGLQPAIQRLLFRRLFFSLRPPASPLEFIHSEAFLDLLAGPAGREIHLPGGLVACKEGANLWLGPATPVDAKEGWEDWGPVPLVIPGVTVLPANRGVVESKWLGPEELPASWRRVSPFEFFLDADRLVFPLYLRPRRPGDRLVPLGLGGRKKVKELLIEAKIPRPQRAAYPLLVDGEDRVLGVLGLRPAEEGKITPATRRVLYLHYRRRS